MIELAGLIFSFAILIIAVMYAGNAIIKSKTISEKAYLIILGLILFVLPIIYILDRYNVPTKMNWSQNIDSQNWLAFLGEFVTGVIGAIIAAVIAVWTTLYQMQKNNEDNDKRDKENNRLQNMPILKYEIDTINDGDIDLEDIIFANLDKCNPYNLNISIKNVGMNTIKSIMIDCSADVISNEKAYRILGRNSIVILEKNEEMRVRKVINLSTGEKYDFLITVYYEDVLSNWYKQDIHLRYGATEKFNKGLVGSIYYDIDKEKIIKEAEINKNII